MDYNRLVGEVQEKAKEYLDDISEDNMRMFAESTKFIAQSVLEDFYLQVDDCYSSGAKRIADGEARDKFMDFANGYRAKMKTWERENEIVLVNAEIDPSLSAPGMPQKPSIAKPALIAGAGTAVVVGLYIFTNIWVAAAAELLVLGIAKKIYQKQIDRSRKDYEAKLKQQETKIEMERNRLVNGLIDDLKKWLGNAEEYSNKLISDFGL